MGQQAYVYKVNGHGPGPCPWNSGNCHDLIAMVDHDDDDLPTPAIQQAEYEGYY